MILMMGENGRILTVIRQRNGNREQQLQHQTTEEDFYPRKLHSASGSTVSAFLMIDATTPARKVSFASTTSEKDALFACLG